MRRNKKKPKLALGDFLKDNANPISQAGNMLGAGIDAMSDPTSEVAGIGSGLLKGAATGAMFGPVGAGIGAAIGGVTGFIGAQDAQAQQTAMNLRKNSSEDQFLLNNGRGFKHGGKMLANRLQVQSGGSLSPVSDDAVEVNANNPGATDSVELQDAYVDDNEIIDRENRVFSDSIKLPNGRTIAKEAKRLEKQKAEDYDTRFTSSNQRVDGKLDELFNYQEQSKGEQTMKKFFKGGTLDLGKDAGQASSLQLAGKAMANSNWDQFKNNLKQVWNGEKGQLNPNSALQYQKATTTIDLSKKKYGGRVSNHDHSVGMPNVSSLLDNSSLINQGISAKLLQRTLGKLDKADWKKGGQMTPALYYTPPANMPKMAGGGRINMANYSARLAEGPGTSMRINTENYKDRVFDHFKLNPSKQFITNPKKVATGITTPTPRVSSERITQRGRLNFKKGGKIGYGGGGQWDEDSQSVVFDRLSGDNATNPLQGNTNANTQGTFNFNRGMTGLATYGPNIVNSLLQKKLQGPIAPQMEQASKLERIDPSAQYAQADTDFNKVNALLTRNTAQAGNLASGLGSNLARKLSANNQIAGQTQHINAGIQGNEAFINMQKQARNADRLTGFQNAQVEFGNKKKQLTSQNVSNLSEKLLMQGRERNQMGLDRDKFNILMGQYGNLPEAMKARYPSAFDYYNENKTGKKKGGHLLDMFKKHKNSNRGNGVIADDPDNLKMGGKLKRNTKNK